MSPASLSSRASSIDAWLANIETLAPSRPAPQSFNPLPSPPASRDFALSGKPPYDLTVDSDCLPPRLDRSYKKRKVTRRQSLDGALLCNRSLTRRRSASAQSDYIGLNMPPNPSMPSPHTSGSSQPPGQFSPPADPAACSS